MQKVALSAAIGVAVAAAVLALPYAGLKVAPVTLMMVAAALSMGAAASVLARTLMDKGPAKTAKELLGSTQIKKGAGSLDNKFPDGSHGSVVITLKPDSKVELLEVIKHPQNYVTKDVMVTLRKVEGVTFNPVELKKLFGALTAQPGFTHLLLRDEHNEFVGYIPGGAAKSSFTGPNAESQIAKYIVGVFADAANSVYLHDVHGASSTDWIDDEKNVAEAFERMSGGFRCLVVLDDANRRKPLGVITYESLMGQTLKAAASNANPSSVSMGDFRPFR